MNNSENSKKGKFFFISLSKPKLESDRRLEMM